MTTEHFANQASTALSTSVGVGDLILSVQGTLHFPTQPEFRIRVGQELMLVTAVAGTTWTVTRGIEGTIAASHALGSTVVAVLTAGGIDELRTEIEAEIPQNTVQTTDPRLSDDRTASGIRSATTVVSVASATAPTAGQVLTATSGTSADWETPSVILAPLPSGGDDGVAINAIIQSAPPGSTIKLVSSGVPYVIDHTQIVAKSNITLDLRGVEVNSFTKYGIQYASILGSPSIPINPPTIATLNGAQATNSTTLSVNWSGAARLADGDYLYIENSETGRVSFRVSGAVIGGSVPIDLPLLYGLETGCSIRKYTPIQNFNILVDGMQWDAVFDSHHIPFDGALDDSRIVYLAVVWQCSVVGKGVFRQVTGPTGDIGIIGLVGFDIGGRNNLVSGFVCIGNDPTSPMSDGLAIEGQRGTIIEHIRGYNIGYGMWFNSNVECRIDDIIDDTGCGVIIPTAIDIAAPQYEMGGHKNTFSGLKMTNMVGGNGAFWTGPDFSDNEITDLTVDGGSYHTGAALVLGANGATPCVRNRIGLLNVSNLSDAIIYGAGPASHDNVIDDLIINNVRTLVTMGTAGQSIQIKNVRGILAVPEKMVDVANAILTMGNVDVTTTDGLRYTNSDSVTLNGATAVYMPAPWVTSTSKVTLARTAPGGTSHGIPTYSIQQNTGNQVGTAGFTAVGLASFDGVVMTENLNNSVHYIVLAALPGYVRGPCVFRVTIKATGRTWVQLAVGPASAFFNVVTGALGSTSGASVIAHSAVVNPDGSVSCTLETRDSASADCYLLMCSDNGVASYLGTGATFELSNLSITGLNFVSLVAETNNNDTYSISVA